ncbi:hypothetical protein LTR99_002480 [Exophiala xenobiotica]|uniref:BRCT domain-containing protein n=1 Tax=Vermiconidia calcicola TaxID=1690605 RepID=A0AAV9QFZ0_9PEZI|nr:hypothetical protein LTR92_005411 [Exophiala xenobiotica]KAK5532052.1 hypothetical protein LTR23_009788 [Chaetothyriales sp. CCFEE 6169]KAK5542183.1 hypothetical protein LTR25_002068 [Vermiconidia calcicola]KAK5306788.1 hypothetical protein LTR99_002480 [Exophiala xenobiotica]KAK5433952.1 hypothetical protein LTR34_003464 [Exophiala xenobiotica]
MAPRKAASPAKPRRVTRARAAEPETKTALDEAPKRKTAPSKAVPTTSRTKAIESKSRVTKKPDTKATKSARLTPVVELVNDSNDEDEIVVAVAQPATRASRSTRTTTTTPTTSTLAAAPRRRIKVTPLDAPAPEPAPVKESEEKQQVKKASAAKEKKEKTTTSKSATTTRAKRDMAAAELEEKVGEPKVDEPMPKKRGRSRANKAEVEDAATTKTATTARKTRGRPKKEDTPVEPVQPSQAPLPTRQTRARTVSSASAAVPESTINVVIPAPARKKVTFQDLPDDDDDEKENKQPVTLSSKSKPAKKTPAPATAKKSETTVAKGIRAKPIRKPAATTPKSTRGSSKAAKQSKTEETEKVMPRVLTPKKITQIAKAMPVEDEDEEDELAGGKTPVRDLSLSPRRGEHVSSVRPVSPVKTLDFTPAFKSPEKSNANASLGIMSPPRRQPSSPLKDSLKESPRRAPEGVAIFRTQIQESSSNGSLSLNPNSQSSQLLQSPKRGLSDKLVFPPSAMKPQHSPLKTGLLSSPARRLFSPSKQKTPGRASPSPIKKQGTPASEQTKSPGDVDLVMSSHFRPSMSPQRLARVYRMSDDELAQETGVQLDFDQSVLNIRSPLKVDSVKPRPNLPEDDTEVDEPIELDEDEHEHEHDKELGVVDPAQLAPVTEAEPGTAADATSDDTVLDPSLEHQDILDEDEEDDEEVNEQNSEETTQDEVVAQTAPRQASIKKPRLSNALFTRLREVDDGSEDELAADQTPVARGQAGLSSANIKSRLSGGIVPPGASRGLGFTPLAAQVRGWRADSPEKRINSPQKSTPASASHGLFSPLARIHVAGSVEVNREGTPAKLAQKRKSMAGRLSFAPSLTESPARPDFFGESMAAQDFEEQVDELACAVYAEEGHQDLHDVVKPQVDAAEELVQEQEQEETSEEDEGSEGSSQHEPGELTTDLIKFTNASDTAMVDFEALASEAKEMAVEEHDEHTIDHDNENEPDAAIPGAEALLTVEEGQSMRSTTSSENYGDENAVPADNISAKTSTDGVLGEAVADNPPSDYAPSSEYEDEAEAEGAEEHAVSSPRNEPEAEAVETYLLGDASTSVALSLSPSVAANTTSATTIEKSIEMDFNITPVRPDPSLARVVHTVAKVPLRPEGTIPTTSSPIKMQLQRKRPRSLSSSHSDSLAVKRRSLGLGLGLGHSPKDAVATMGMDALATTPRAKDQDQLLHSSPQRRIRSAAPSPAHSLATGGSMTPGQFSFAIEDFGNSTLDGIELPEDMMFSDDMEAEEASSEAEPEAETEGHAQEDTVMTIGSALFKTPVAAPKGASMAPPPSTAESNAAATATPHYARSTRSSRRKSLSTPSRPSLTTAATPVPLAARTPAMATKAKTPSTSLKSRTPATRTPLKPVGDGPLSGAVVHYDIHTSEGSDASAFYIDMLTSMGARCIKEWRWNPRASLFAVNPESAENEAESEAPSQAVGVTHVVYKDGGKRTLEKVRSAKGQVLCVGVSWVLDCHREQKWLDEAVYAVDTGIMPRGGSRRRKSMEPRILRNENGAVSATKQGQGRGRKSLPAAHFGNGNPDLKETKLAKTPVRALQQVEAKADKENEVELQLDDDEVEGEGQSDEEEQEQVRPEVDVDVQSDGVDQDTEEEDETDIASAYSAYDSPAAATVGDGGETMDMRYLVSDIPRDGDDSTPLQVSNMAGTATPVVSLKKKKAGMTTPQSAKLNLQVDYDPRTAATPLTPYMAAKGVGMGMGMGRQGQGLVQMSAPPKQINKSIFECDDEDGDENENEKGQGQEAGLGTKEKKKKKFQVRMRATGAGAGDGAGASRRRTLAGVNLAFKPVVESLLRRE